MYVFLIQDQYHQRPEVDFRRRQVPLRRPIETVQQKTRRASPKGVEVRASSSPEGGGPVGWMMSWVRVFGGKQDEIATTNIWRLSIDASRHRIWREGIDTDEGVDRADPSVDVERRGERAGSLAGWEKVTVREGVLEERTYRRFQQNGILGPPPGQLQPRCRSRQTWTPWSSSAAAATVLVAAAHSGQRSSGGRTVRYRPSSAAGRHTCFCRPTFYRTRRAKINMSCQISQQVLDRTWPNFQHW